MLKKITLLSSLFASILLSSCKGQVTHQSIETKTTISGDSVSQLGDNIMTIYQDKQNNYWFGSWKTGVYRYDGKKIINFTAEHGLAGNRIDEIKEDHLGNIYFTSCHPESAITKFDGKEFTILKSIPSEDWKLESDDLWFKNAYGTEKVYRYNGTTLFELTIPKPANLSNRFEIYSIYKDIKGSVWFGANPSGVCRFDGKAFDWITEEDVTEFRDEGANGVRSVLEDKNGDFWFNTEQRYTVYGKSDSVENKFYERHQSIGSLDGIKDGNLDEYLSSLIDKENNLWFVTYLDGVWKYDGEKVTHYPVEIDSEQIALFSIYEDNEGKLWLGTHENGVYWLDGDEFVPLKE